MSQFHSRVRLFAALLVFASGALLKPQRLSATPSECTESMWQDCECQADGRCVLSAPLPWPDGQEPCSYAATCVYHGLQTGYECGALCTWVNQGQCNPFPGC